MHDRHERQLHSVQFDDHARKSTTGRGIMSPQFDKRTEAAIRVHLYRREPGGKCNDSTSPQPAVRQFGQHRRRRLRRQHLLQRRHRRRSHLQFGTEHRSHRELLPTTGPRWPRLPGQQRLAGHGHGHDRKPYRLGGGLRQPRRRRLDLRLVGDGAGERRLQRQLVQRGKERDGHFQPVRNYTFTATIINGSGLSTTSSVTVTVTMPTAPTVTTNPTNQTVNAGGTASFTAAASGNPAPTVQWEVNTGSGFTT